MSGREKKRGDGVVESASSDREVKKRRIELTIPVYVEEGIVLRMSQHVLDLKDEKTGREMDVACGAGLGGDFVTLSDSGGKDGEKHRAVFYLRDALAAFVESYDPDAAEGMPRSDVDVDD